MIHERICSACLVSDLVAGASLDITDDRQIVDMLQRALDTDHENEAANALQLARRRYRNVRTGSGR